MHAPGPPPHPQALADAEHLKILSVCHYVMAGLSAVTGCFPIIHVMIGGMMVSGRLPMAKGSGPSPEWFGWFFIVIGGGVMLAIWAYAVACFLAARWLAARQRRTFCFVVACVSCLHVPLGTALGVFTLIVLMRPSVQALFGQPLPGHYLNR